MFILSNYIIPRLQLCCCDVSNDFCVKTTFDSYRLPILLQWVHFAINLICSVLRMLVSNMISCCPSFCSFISMFALMLICVTSDLEIVSSAWSKYFSFINKNKNNYRLPWCILKNCRSICNRLLNICIEFRSTLACTTD